jgi:hypothetical protein
MKGQALKQVLFRRPFIWLFLYYVLALFSTVWAARPDYTLYRSFEALLFLVLIVDAIASLEHFDSMIKFQLLFGLCLVIFWHFNSLAYDFSIASLHSSLTTGSVIYLAFLGLHVHGKRWQIIYAIIVLSIVLSTSSASYLSLLVGLGSVVLFTSGRKRFLGLAAIALISFLITAYGFDFLEIIFFGKSESTIMTASGRIPVWQWVYDSYVALKPYFGYGFGEGEVLARFYNIEGLRMQHMHNAFMGALTNLGYAGLTLYLIVILDTGISVMKVKNMPHRSYFIGGWSALTLNSFAISSLTSPVSFGFISSAMFYIMVIVLINTLKRQNKPAVSSQRAKARINGAAFLRNK